MSGDIGSWILGSKRPKNKVAKQVAKIGGSMGKQSVVSRTIQAGQGILKVGDAVNKVNDLAGNLNDFIPKAGNLAQSMEKCIPTMQLISKSFCDSTKLLAHFSLAMTAMGIGANIIQTYQGNQALELIAARLQDISTTLSAQTALMAQKEFPGYVYKMIRERLGQTMDDQFCDHWFFLYHPDDDWYPEFYHLLEQNPLEPRFCGYTNQLDTIFVFMMMARKRQSEKEAHARERSRPIRPVKLHLLIPAYSPILIAELLRIPDEIGDFVIEGRINNHKEFVWFNLPEEQRHHVVGVGQWAPPTETWWEKMTWNFGLSRKEPLSQERRTLGRMQEVEDIPAPEVERIPYSKNDDENSTAADSTVDNKTKRRHATPIHQHRKRQHGKRRPADQATKVKS
ncbi:hypothetical protein HJFPF1_05268 [Paramyrothecium foliicola]|nr:hypothetical protein HJFPF1_05268 [Paramyrothecium foliicola]